MTAIEKKAKINQTCQGKLNKFENIVDNVIFFTVISVFLHSTWPSVWEWLKEWLNHFVAGRIEDKKSVSL